MAKKTKAELMEEIKIKDEEIKNLELEIEKLERYKTYEDMADEMSAIRESFVKVGFSKTESFTMMLKMIEMASNPLVMAALKK